MRYAHGMLPLESCRADGCTRKALYRRDLCYHHLKEKDEDIKEKIDAVEKSLTEKLSPDLTAEEIAEKFRSIGIQPGEN